MTPILFVIQATGFERLPLSCRKYSVSTFWYCPTFYEGWDNILAFWVRNWYKLLGTKVFIIYNCYIGHLTVSSNIREFEDMRYLSFHLAEVEKHCFLFLLFKLNSPYSTLLREIPAHCLAIYVHMYVCVGCTFNNETSCRI